MVLEILSLNCAICVVQAFQYKKKARSVNSPENNLRFSNDASCIFLSLLPFLWESKMLMKCFIINVLMPFKWTSAENDEKLKLKFFRVQLS